VAVADLSENQLALVVLRASGIVGMQSEGFQDSTFDYTHGRGTGPCHAFEKSTAIDAISVMVKADQTAWIGIEQFWV
jgi:hypothetical protein